MTLTRKKVYEKAGQIPEGCFSTYKIIAHELGSQAYRFVGSALKNHNCELNNKDEIVVPKDKVCFYRVIKTDFSIGRYLFDKLGDKFLAKKERLEKEGIGFEKKGNKWIVKKEDWDKLFTFHKGKCGCKKCKS